MSSGLAGWLAARSGRERALLTLAAATVAGALVLGLAQALGKRCRGGCHGGDARTPDDGARGGLEARHERARVRVRALRPHGSEVRS